MDKEKNLHEGHRERMINKFSLNPSMLSDHELLEVLLFGILQRVDTNRLAHQLIRRFGSLKNVFDASVEELCSVSGVGKKTATHLSAIGKIFSVIDKKDKPKKVVIRSLEGARQVISADFDGVIEEKLILYLLNEKYVLINSLEFENQLMGEVSVDTTELGKIIAIHKPKFAILAHNHPSGNVLPSEVDDSATVKFMLLCNLHGVDIIDHVIVSKDKEYSYRNENRLEDLKRKADIKKMFS